VAQARFAEGFDGAEEAGEESLRENVVVNSHQVRRGLSAH
jgi:hypothetical protein